MAKVVETATLRPGKCAISGETQGPFLDTGHTVPRYGRIYLSFRWLAEPMDEVGWITPEVADDLKAKVSQLQEENARLTEIEEDHKTLVDVVSEYLPEPEPQVITETVVQERKPTDEEIADWIEREGGNHPAVRAARSPEPGSTEEWQRLYGETGPQKAKPVVNPETDGNEEPEEEAVETDEGPERHVELHGQSVDLDKVLDQNVGDVLAFAEGQDEEFVEALVAREVWKGQERESGPRKSLLEGLGYELETEDEETE